MMFDALFCFGGMVVTFIIFDILFYALNHSVLLLFVPIQKLLSGIKNKVFCRYFLYSIFLGLSVAIKSVFTLNYLVYGICLGFFYSLSNMLFEKGLLDE